MIKNNFGAQVVDYGDIKVEEERGMYPPVEFAVRNLNVLGPVLGKLHHRAHEIISKKNEDLLLTVGGDHSIAAATIPAIRKVYKDLKVVWVDAHADCSNSHMRNPDKMHS